jgi:hypothetical protein
MGAHVSICNSSSLLAILPPPPPPAVVQLFLSLSISLVLWFGVICLDSRQVSNASLTVLNDVTGKLYSDRQHPVFTFSFETLVVPQTPNGWKISDNNWKRFFYLSFNRQSEYKVFHKVMCWLGVFVDCLTWWGPLQRGDLISQHYWLRFGSSSTRFL